MPSDADLTTFSRHGYFHMIVCLPYSLETFRAYDRYGQSAEYSVGDYGYLLDNNPDDFFDESDVVTDDDEFKPGFFDEDDDEFFKHLDDEEERINHYEEFERRNQINVISNTQMPNQVIKIELNRLI